MARSLVFLWALSTVLLLGMLVLAPPPAASRVPLFLIEGIAAAVLGALVVARRALSVAAAETCAYLCYLIVGAVILTYGDRSSPCALFYLWLSVHGFYFLPWRRAARQIAFIALTYGAVLLAVPGSGVPVLRWTITLATMSVIGTLVASLRLRVEALVSRAAGTAATDALTGLGNRRAFDALLGHELERSERTGESLALVLLDLDRLKEVNDRLGHQAGDAYLRRLSSHLGSVLRSTEPAYRLGGDEFAILLVNTEGWGAHLFAERLRMEIRTEFRSEPVPMTTSLGIACFPEQGHDAESLFRAADQALYLAKQTGRDRSVLHRSAAPPPPRAPAAVIGR
jgi:diguanylate cyclase (GGDEF)-like protein